MSLAREQREEHVAAPAKPFDVDAEIAALEPGERDAAREFLATYAPGAGAPLAIVIPAYNEEPTVAEVIAEIPGEAAGLQTEVIVVVDGSKDATAAEARKAGALVCDVPINRGQGAERGSSPRSTPTASTSPRSSAASCSRSSTTAPTSCRARAAWAPS